MVESSLSEELGRFSAASDEELLSLSPDEESTAAVRTPEALIRRETRAIGYFRLAVALLLGSASIILSLFVFFYTRSVERSAFTADFESCASRLAETFVDVITHRLDMTKTLAAAITSTMEAQGAGPANFSFAPGRMKELTQNAMVVEKSLIATWSPLLRTDEERREFEEYVGSKEPRQDLRCFLCGSPNRRIANPNEVVSVVGHGTFPCSALETATLNGAVRRVYCPVLSKHVEPVCGCVDVDPSEKDGSLLTDVAYPSSIFIMDEETKGTVPVPYGQPPYSPIWEVNTLASKSRPYLYDLFHSPNARNALELVVDGNGPVITETFVRSGAYFEMFDLLLLNQSSTLIIGPVYDSTGEKIVGFTMTERPWSRLFLKTKEAFSDTPMLAVIQNSFGQELAFTPDFRLGSLDFHDSWQDLYDPDFQHLAVNSSYEDFDMAIKYGSPWPRNRTSLAYCRYRIVVYPTLEHRNSFITNRPYIFASATLFSFIFSAIVFALYDWLVRRRQRKVMEVAIRTDRIVASLYPENVRNRLFRQVGEIGSSLVSGKSKIENLFDKGLQNAPPSSEPIADIFPSATVMFFDIANFTVWSSERSPSAIFTLLESIYGALDNIAGRLGVFKVETIGDAYVAVCGLPKANPDHAVIMARFGSLCLSKFAKLVQSLEVRLGPSTGDLQARVGLHSGPVVAGVLRGTKARFQLFGDTVNTASRLESTSRPMHIHATRATCDLLVQAGKGHWIRARDDIATLKGKASSQTYWVNPNLPAVGEESSSGVSDLARIAVVVSHSSAKKKILRLVEWNVEVLYELLQVMVAVRQRHSFEHRIEPKALMRGSHSPSVVDEIVSVLDLPKYDEAQIQRRKEASKVVLPAAVRSQLYDFVLEIAMSYHDVPFHNFDHASHVVMSARTLMQRVIEPGGIDFSSMKDTGAQIHQCTYGISSDPLMAFTVVFSSLIHDCGHTGLTNEELAQLNSPMAQLYRNKSIAEQNSVNKAWDILCEPRFEALRACIYTNQAELVHFRQLLVNSVISTDLADSRLKTLRESRWEAAFLTESECSPPLGEFQQYDANRRATVIYEYIIQAADVAHTMQHWNTYQKFNRRLFEERYVAWVNGYAGDEPSINWYKGELGFFDFYIIPLAKKLNRCGVFGASYDALVTYALENRKEWEQKGHEIVASMQKHCLSKYGTITEPSEEATASLSEILSTCQKQVSI